MWNNFRLLAENKIIYVNAMKKANCRRGTSGKTLGSMYLTDWKYQEGQGINFDVKYLRAIQGNVDECVRLQATTRAW